MRYLKFFAMALVLAVVGAASAAAQAPERRHVTVGAGGSPFYYLPLVVGKAIRGNRLPATYFVQVACLLLPEGRRCFQRVKEFELGLIAHRADGDLYLYKALVVFGLDAQQAHSGRHDPFQVHEHSRPIQTLLIDEGIQECRALVNQAIVGLRKKLLEILPLRFQSGHFPPQLGNIGPLRLIGFAHRVHMPPQRRKENGRDYALFRRPRKKTAVRLQGFRR